MDRHLSRVKSYDKDTLSLSPLPLSLSSNKAWGRKAFVASIIKVRGNHLRKCKPNYAY